MKTEFDVQLHTADMYRYNLYHTYTTASGYLAILAADGAVYSDGHSAAGLYTGLSLSSLEAAGERFSGFEKCAALCD